MLKTTFVILIFFALLFNACSDSPSGNDGKNHSPEIISLVSNPDTIDTGDTSTLTCSASDSDGDSLTFVWESVSGSINGSGSNVNWLSPDSVGTYFVTCKVLDGNGGEAIDSVEIVVEQKIPTEGLVAYYPFNGNANDESGNGNDGIVIGALLTTDRFGKTESAYVFDGIDDYIDIGVNVKPPLPVTISSWVNLNSIHSGGIFQNDKQDSRSYRYGLRIHYYDTGKLAGHLFEGFSAPWNRSGILSNDSLLSISSWHHFAVIFHSNNYMELYWDGVKYDGIYSGTGSGLSYSNGNGTIGMIVGEESPRPVDGKIDDILVYDRALSEAEIQLIYHKNGWGN